MNSISILRSVLAGSVSVLALSGAALAQSANPDTGVETVEVSASRVTANGFSAPTPVTVLGADAIEAAAEPSIENLVVDLPTLQGSRTTTQGNIGVSGGGNGIQTLGLRGMGTNRTLVMVDGQRIVPAALDGTVDTGELPQALISRVDVVTGGASASWGSDAVAGVVNFILDKKFTGFKANFSAGESNYSDDKQGLAQLTAGMDFAGGKGHIEASTEFSNNDGVPRGIGSRTWYQAPDILQQTIAATPKGAPEYVGYLHVSLYQFTPGGIITAGPLMGVNFGKGGAVSQFVYGSPIVGQYMVGGDQTSQIGAVHGGLDPAEKRGTFYGRVSYDLTPDVSFYADVMYGEEHNRTLSVADQYQQANLTMSCTNPFLPASVMNACATNHITSFQYGTNVQDLDSDSNVGGDNAVVTRAMRRITAGANGAFGLFGTDWTWNGYAEHGENSVSDTLTNMLIIPLFKQAINATLSPTGSIVCASTVAQAEGCVPLNIFGTGVADPRALNWVEGNENHGPFLNTEQREESAELTFNGSPVSDWAGPVSFALGASYREEAEAQQDDGIGSGSEGNPSLPAYVDNNPFLSSAGKNWQTGNFAAAPAGSYHISEAFLETVVPLVKDEMFGAANLDLAGRATVYSSAGYVSTWKVGTTWDTPIDGVRFRALQSRDVRAPNLGELISPGTTGYGDVIDDFPPYAGQQFNVYGTTAGNRNLLPEKGQTTEAGVVFSPTWFPGFDTSIDYWRIALKGGISSESSQQEMDSCYQGNQDICKLITFDSSGLIPLAILSTKVNLSSIVTDGFDIESSYHFNMEDVVPFLGADGEVMLRSLATHTSKYIATSGVVGVPSTESAGDNSGNIPLWKWLGTESYTVSSWNLTFTEQYISPGTLTKSWIACDAPNCPLPTVAHPTIATATDKVKGALYLDIGGSYNVTPEAQIYFKLDNALNLDPPVVYPTGFNVNGSNAGLYDTVGRYYRIGFRVTL